MYKTINKWYNDIDNPDVLSEIYIRDASIILINKLNTIDEKKLKDLLNSINIIRNNGTNGEKLIAGKAIYIGLNIEDIDKLLNHLNTSFSDIINKYK